MVAELLVAAILQLPVVNPTKLWFTCPDHAQDTQHEVDVVDAATGQVVSTILVGDPPEVNGEVEVTLNVQPIKFGQYTFVARAIAGSVKSENSEPSDVWHRSPGAPSKPIIRK